MGSRILVPPHLGELLVRSEFAEAVHSTLRRFEPLLGDKSKQLFFFPEFTDHGCNHLTSVLASAEALIPQSVWGASSLSGDDAAVLILATLLHDCAMHLSADGFLSLLRNEEKPPGTTSLINDQSWPELFDEFFTMARRWDGAALHRILGDVQNDQSEAQDDLYAYVQRPSNFPDPETWTTAYRKFLGEFVRRQHPRLAHEIALLGVPGCEDNRKICISEDIPSYLKDLAGIIARSHGMRLRDTFGYLKRCYGGRVTCNGVHAVYLMALLRIADYLQMQSSRVNSAALNIQRLRSPISVEEWNKHLATHTVQWPYEEDDESVYVHAQPKSARSFVAMTQLLSGLQNELDTTCAVLGEVFSHQGTLRSLQLGVRRVRSNLDDPTKFMEDSRPGYLPVLVRFDAAGSDLLKLLIRPLYGDRPEIGVRELLQNALDAVHERKHLQSSLKPFEEGGVSKGVQPDVVILAFTRADGSAWLSIEDSGIGMTADVIRNYFLRAGASFRRSDAWRNTFEEDEQAKVLRSGRFGVGALAAFLLGDQIEVVSRHLSARDQTGIRFSARITDEAIDLVPVQQCAQGTTILVKLSKLAQSVLFQHSDAGSRDRWDWFALSSPKVRRIVKVNGRENELHQRFSLPFCGQDPLPAAWHRISHADFRDIQWTTGRAAPYLTCNGIVINSRESSESKASESPYAWGEYKQIPFPVPSVSVFDADGRLPLILQRDRLETDVFPFSDELLYDASLEFVAFLLAVSPTRAEDVSAYGVKHPARRSLLDLILGSVADGMQCIFGETKEGAVFFHPWHIRQAGIRSALWLDPRNHLDYRSFLKDAGSAIFWNTFDNWDDFDAEIQNFERLLPKFGSNPLNPIGCAIIAPNRFDDQLHAVARSVGEFPQNRRNIADDESDDEPEPLRTLCDSAMSFGWYGYWSAAMKHGIGELDEWYRELGRTRSNLTFAVQWRMKPKLFMVEKSPVVDVFDKLLKDPVIPFKRTERKRKFREAYVLLGHRIQAWEKQHGRLLREIAMDRARNVSNFE
jgi:hypothetical protein